MGQGLLWWTPAAGPARGARRRQAVVLLALAVLALHAGLLVAPSLKEPLRMGDGHRAALRVRVLPMPAPAESGRAAPTQVGAPSETEPSPAPAPAPARSAAPGQGQTLGATARATPAPAPAASASPTSTSTPPDDRAGVAPPLYPTRLPPDGEWTYALTRGGRSASARLTWRHDDSGYSAQLEGIGEALQWRSRGGVDDAGLRPERFVDQRDRRRDAANFELEAGRIGYSGSAADQPAFRGSQDRLSLLLQLAAILDARRSPPHAGEVFVLHVSGARGDAALWRFEVQGPERITLADGRQRFALKLVREPAGPWDTRAEVWTDPGAHHLPLRLRWRNGAQVLELLLAPALDQAGPDAP